MFKIPVDNFESVVGENPTPYVILALWAVNRLSIVYWDANTRIAFLFADALLHVNTPIKESYHDVENPDQLRVLAFSTLP